MFVYNNNTYWSCLLKIRNRRAQNKDNGIWKFKSIICTEKLKPLTNTVDLVIHRGGCKKLGGSFLHLSIAFFRNGLDSSGLRIWRNLFRTVVIKSSESITTYIGGQFCLKTSVRNNKSVRKKFVFISYRSHRPYSF